MAQYLDRDQADHRPPTLFERIEVLAGSIFFAVFSFSFIGGCVFLFASLKDGNKANPALIIVIGAVLCIGELRSAIFLARTSATATSPILLKLVERQPRLPPGIQATWWLWHFVAMTYAPHAIFEEIRLRYGILPQSIGSTIVIFALTVSAGVAGNACLLLAADTIYRGKKIVNDLYRMRFVVDVFIATVVPSLPFHAQLIFGVPIVFLFRGILHK